MKDLTDSHTCEDHLEFQGHLGAPGTGLSYHCSICNKAFWASSCDAKKMPFEDLDPGAFILDPADCI